VLTREQGGLRTPFFSGYQPRFFFRTKDVAGRVEIPRCIEVVMPGDMVKITGRLELPMAMEKRQHFAMREAIHLEGKRILRGMAGAGIVTEVLDGLVSWDRAL
jgi:elongation factor Tu